MGGSDERPTSVVVVAMEDLCPCSFSWSSSSAKLKIEVEEAVVPVVGAYFVLVEEEGEAGVEIVGFELSLAI